LLCTAAAAAAQEKIHRSAGYQPHHGLNVLVIHGFSPFLKKCLFAHVLHHGEQVLENVQETGSRGYNHHRRHDEKKDWKYQLHSNLRGAFFRLLPASRTQVIRVGPQRFAHTGAKAVVLNQDRDQFPDFVLTGAFGEVS
jgi:hypothetical protein